MNEKQARKIQKAAGKVLLETADEEIHVEFPRARYLRSFYGEKQERDLFAGLFLFISNSEEDIKKFSDKMDDLRREIKEPAPSPEAIQRTFVIDC